MTQGAFSGHCERFEESRGNLKFHLGTFSTAPQSPISSDLTINDQPIENSPRDAYLGHRLWQRQKSEGTGQQKLRPGGQSLVSCVNGRVKTSQQCAV